MPPNVVLSPHMVYASPGAGSVALACNHGLRYPDLCEECTRVLAITPPPKGEPNCQ